MSVCISIANVVDFCVASASACIESGNNRQANDLMKAEIGEIARQISLWQMSGEAKARLFFRPIQLRLLDLYGPTVGESLCHDFIDAFWLQSWTDVPLDFARLARDVEPTSEWHRRILARQYSIRRMTVADFSSALASTN